MKYLLKGFALLAVSMLVQIAVNKICNKYGIELNTTVTTMVSDFLGLPIYLM